MTLILFLFCSKYKRNKSTTIRISSSTPSICLRVWEWCIVVYLTSVSDTEMVLTIPDPPRPDSHSVSSLTNTPRCISIGYHNPKPLFRRESVSLLNSLPYRFTYTHSPLPLTNLSSPLHFPLLRYPLPPIHLVCVRLHHPPLVFLFSHTPT